MPYFFLFLANFNTTDLSRQKRGISKGFAHNRACLERSIHTYPKWYINFFLSFINIKNAKNQEDIFSGDLC